MDSNIWVEVNINIGSRSLKIQINKGESIEAVVNNFIQEYKISEKYFAIIVSMIKEQIKLKLDEDLQNNRIVKHQKKQQVSKQLNNNLNPKSPSQSLIKKQNKLLAEMQRIKEQINKKRQLSLSAVKNKSNIPNNQNIVTQSFKQNFSEIANIKESKKVLNKVPQKKDTNKNQIEKKIEEIPKRRKIFDENEKSKLNTFVQTAENLKSQGALKTQNIIKQDIVELKSLLNQNPPTIEVDKKKARINTEKNMEEVFTKWKQLQQSRKVVFESKYQKEKKKLQIKKHKPEKHQSQYFYKKGISFIEKKTKNSQNMFKQLYPFRPSKSPNKVDTKMVTDRLYNDAKSKSSKRIVNKIEYYRTEAPQYKPKFDPIKQKVRKRDLQYDEVISQLIDQGLIKNQVSIRKKNVSPFRKIVL